MTTNQWSEVNQIFLALRRNRQPVQKLQVIGQLRRIGLTLSTAEFADLVKRFSFRFVDDLVVAD